ncbi:MAG: hypothetical protein ACM3XN_11490 [Chloroflexota bacterium]
MRRRFRERYNEASDRLEHSVARWLVVLVAILLLSQLLLSGRNSLAGLLGAVDRLDNTAAAGLVGGQLKELPESYAIIRVLDHRTAWRAYVLVNGQEVGSFRGTEVVAPVKPGDLIEIDATAYSGAVSFRIVGVSSNLREPRLGDEVTTRGNIAQFKRVR